MLNFFFLPSVESLVPNTATNSTFNVMAYGPFIFRDGTVPAFSPETLALHTSCLAGWSLLSTLLSPAQLFESVGRRVALMSGLFSAPDLELRIAAGETIALLLENAYDHDEVRQNIVCRTEEQLLRPQSFTECSAGSIWNDHKYWK